MQGQCSITPLHCCRARGRVGAKWQSHKKSSTNWSRRWCFIFRCGERLGSADEFDSPTDGHRTHGKKRGNSHQAASRRRIRVGMTFIRKLTSLTYKKNSAFILYFKALCHIWSSQNCFRLHSGLFSLLSDCFEAPFRLSLGFLKSFQSVLGLYQAHLISQSSSAKCLFLQGLVKL